MTNLPAKKTSNHWGKYKVYYLVGASFLLLLTFILLFNSQNNREIKRISRQLSQSENENSWPTPRSPGRRDPYRQEEAGDFILPSDEQRNENWLAENVFQDRVRSEFKTWVNSVKYLPSYRIGGQQESERHALFYGPPGSGKSYLAQKFAENEGLAYIFANFGFKLYVGSNQVAIDNAMDQAASLLKKYGDAKPVVFIVDEIDSLGRKMPLSHSSVQEVNGLLTMVDRIKERNLNIIVIGITNYPEVLDPALKRAGRLGRQIEVPYLSKEEITNMVKFVEKDMKGDKVGAYKYEGNKSKWKDKDKDKDKEIEWPSNFWSEVLQTTYEAFEKCKRNGVGVSYTEIEQSVKEALAAELSKNSKKITPKSANFKAELDKKVKDKIKGKPKPQPTPPREPEPIPKKPDDE